MINFAKKRKLYESAPDWVQAGIGAIPFSWLAGSAYRQYRKSGRKLETASPEEVKAFTAGRLSQILDYATTHVPAYLRHRAIVERLPPYEAIKDFPFIDKEIIIEDPTSYLSNELENLSYYKATTGGSTGRQFEIILDNQSQSIELAFVHRQWARVGYSTSHRKATFRGTNITISDNVMWKRNPIYNELQFSPFHISDENIPLYIKKIQDYKPLFLHGYPSAIDMLSEYIIRNNIIVPKINAVLLASEGTCSAQRDRIEDAFKTRVYTFYGHSERVIMAGECEYSTDYHSFPDYGFFELLGADGTTQHDEGSYGEIVGTGLINRVMPLIRYRTDDMARLRTTPCECGRCWPRFSDVDGHRTVEYMTGRSGAKISLTAINMHGDIFQNVVRFQYVHKKAGQAVIRLQPAPHFSSDDERAILAAHHDKVSGEINFSIERCSELPLTRLGKLRRLVDH